MSTTASQEEPRSNLQPSIQASRLDHQGASATQRSTYEVLDSALQLSVQVVKILNTNVKHRANLVSKELLAGISNISGLLFLLKRLLQEETSKSSWDATMYILCAPSGTLVQFVKSLRLLVPRPTVGPLLEVDLVEIWSAIDEQKAVFLAALRNDPVSAALLETTRMRPALPIDLSEIYCRILLSLLGERALRAHRAFQWLAFSKRQLYLNELVEAANLSWEKSSQDTYENFTGQYDVVDECMGLIAITPDTENETASKWVNFAHHTVKEYLLSEVVQSSPAAKFSITEVDAHILLSNVTLSCLRSYLQSSLSHRDSSENTEPGSDSSPLLSYAREYWYYHLSIVENKGRSLEPISQLAIDILDIMRKESLSRGADTSNSDGVGKPEGVCSKIWGSPPPLYCASLWGLKHLVRILVGRGEHLDEKDGFGGTPLQAAKSNSHIEIVDFLLHKGATVNLVSGYCGNALQAAACCGNGPIVQRLLDADADVNATCGHYGYALQAAAANGHAELVQLLLANGANVNALGGEFESSLIAAAHGGNTEVARLLLVNGADANARGEKTDTALSKATALGHVGIVKWLLKTNIDHPNVRDSQGRSVLEVAVHEGHVEIVRMLLQKGVRHGRALKLAAHRRYPDILEMLLQNWATVESSDPDSKHVWKLILSLAIEQDNPDLIKLLLTRTPVITFLKGQECLSLLDGPPP